MKAAVKHMEHSILSLSPFAELNYERTYSFSSLVILFFTFSGAGWLWEVLLHIIEDGMIINRGVMTGPWLPIYGTGTVLMLVLLKRWRTSPFRTFGMIIVLCGIIEYGTSYVLESLFGAQWWDYSDMLLNVNGRICLEGLLIFGIGGLLIIYMAAPKIDNYLNRLPSRAKAILCIFLAVVFIGDLIRSFVVPNMGFGITT